MNNKSYLLAVVFCAVSKLQADAPQNTDQLKTSVELSQGYRRDNLTTKISRHNLDSSLVVFHFQILTHLLGK